MDKLNLTILKILNEEYNKDPSSYVTIEFLKNKSGELPDANIIALLRDLEHENFVEFGISGLGQGNPSEVKIASEGRKFLEEENFGNKLKKILSHPLVVALIVLALSIPLTALATYQTTISSINYQYESQNQLKVTIIGAKEFFATPDKDYIYSGVGLYNPTLKQISLDNLQYFPSEGWFPKVEQKNITITGENGSGIPNLPSFPNINQPSYTPYMVLDAGKFSQMNGIFKLHTPKMEGDYYMKFCAHSLDDKTFCSNDNLLIHVRINQTNLTQ